MAIFEGTVGLFVNANGAVEIRKTNEGGYAATEVAEMLEAIMEAGKPVSGYSLWLDQDMRGKDGTVTTTNLKKALKTGTPSLQMVRRRTKAGRQFPVPVIRVVDKDSEVTTIKPDTSKRIGK